MASEPSASSQDPTLFCAYFGGPRDGLKSGDLPVVLSGKKLTGMVARLPLSQPHEFSLYAAYECVSEGQVDGFWQFQFRGLEGPNGELLVETQAPDPSVDAEDALIGEPVGGARHEAGRGVASMMKRHRGAATWESKVRGLMIGLALGDALGAARAGDIPADGPLRAGAASQLAAWTAEGLLRRSTRYGGVFIDEEMSTWNDSIRYAYQRWASLRGVARRASGWWAPEDDDEQSRGWLQDSPVMAKKRGHSPSIESAIATGAPSSADSCRPVIKGLPIAVYAGHGRLRGPNEDDAAVFAKRVAEITHRSDRVAAASALAVRIAVRCIRAENSFAETVDASTIDAIEPGLRHAVVAALDSAGDRRPDVAELARIAPNDKARSVLAGALYSASVFPAWHQAMDAIELARRAPDGDGVAALTGAFVGAVHGYEAFPTETISRLELGWVMDRLALDLALEAKDNQVPIGGWKEGGEPWPEPWWDAKYPGV